MELSKMLSTCILFGIKGKAITSSQSIIINYNDKNYPIKSMNGLKRFLKHFNLKPLVNSKFNYFLTFGKYEGWSIYVVYRKDRRYLNGLLTDPTFKYNNPRIVLLMSELDKIYRKL